ncbi:hypothetical protein HYX00_01670 [Candidatus Woesearchaeota archaeon]|nr:hypothetical protein [Candidatus Woesearchaeota archaeon]
MKKKSVKSQITMLMLLGLVLFIAVSFVLYFSKSSVKKQSQQSIKNIQETAIDTLPIKEFVANCLDKLAKDAVALLGRQGGYIYSSQGGALIDYAETDEGLFFVKHNNLNIAYNILPPKFESSPYSSDIPDYPWSIFPYKTEISNEEIFEGFFGIDNMPPLNSSEGPNSIQTQIETFIDNNFMSCADVSLFRNQGYNIEIDNSKTQVIIGSNGITIKSKIPITINNPSTKESTKISDFSTNIDIRLRNIYFFTKELIKNDIQNIKFNISDTNNNKDSLSIQLIKNIFSDEARKIKADLIIVADEKSLIYGKPFEYAFARRNRAPALYYIKQNNLEFPHLHTINQNGLLRDSELKAEDPDEDSYTFTITPTPPKVLNIPQLKFKIEVSDGKLSDYQIITVNRI